MHQKYIGDFKNLFSVVDDRTVTTRFKHVDITVCFKQEQFDNGLFVPKYENSSVMLVYMCTKICSGIIISQINKWMVGFRFYPTSDI